MKYLHFGVKDNMLLVEMKPNDLRTHYKIVLFVTSRTMGIPFYWYVRICKSII